MRVATLLCYLIDTSGWIDAAAHTTDGVHLNLEGNRIAAEKLAAILKKELPQSPN